MKNLMLAVVVVVTVLSSNPASFAQTGCPPGSKSRELQKWQQIDAVERENLPLEAMYWSYRVKILGDVTYEDLVAKSRNWLMLEETKKELLSAVRAHLDNASARQLTPEERKRYEAGLRKTRAMLAGAKAPKGAALEAKADELTCSIFELEAKYWAWAVNTAKTVSLKQLNTYSRDWVGSRGVNTALMERVRLLVRSGATPPLTTEETARRSAAKDAIKAALSEARKQ